MHVVEISHDWRERYETFVAKSLDTMIYYAWSYRTFLEELLGSKAVYFGVIDDAGKLLGVRPLMAKDGPLGVVYNSLPFFGSYGGVLSASAPATALLWAAYDAVTTTKGAASATVVLNPLATQAIPVHWNFEDSRIGQFTDLDFGDDESQLMERIDPSARRNVRVAERAGFVVSVENSIEALQQLAKIHRGNILAIGGRVKPDDFFTLIPKHFAANIDYKIYTARKDGEIVAALLLFYYGGIVEYFTPGTLLAYRGAQPSALLIKQAMLDAASDGNTLWNWGGTWDTQEGVLKFKRKWGAKDRVYRYYTRLNNPLMLNCTPEQLLEDYNFFYTVPFSKLHRIALPSEAKNG